MKGYRTSELTAYFNAELYTVWEAVTNNKEYSWRSDLSKIEIMDEGMSFIEYAVSGDQISFHITDLIQNQLYKFDMRHKMWDGHWQGDFSSEDGRTKIIFTEQIRIHNPVMRVLSYLFMDLKKMQQTYVSDLKKKLEEA